MKQLICRFRGHLWVIRYAYYGRMYRRCQRCGWWEK